MTKFRRVYEAAILKTLGASSRLIATMLLLEYGVLGAIAGTVGAAGCGRAQLGSGPVRARSAVAARAAADDRRNRGDRSAVAAIGVLASLDVLRHKPLSTLRAE